MFIFLLSFTILLLMSLYSLANILLCLFYVYYFTFIILFYVYYFICYYFTFIFLILFAMARLHTRNKEEQTIAFLFFLLPESLSRAKGRSQREKAEAWSHENEWTATTRGVDRSMTENISGELHDPTGVRKNKKRKEEKKNGEFVIFFCISYYRKFVDLDFHFFANYPTL